jgi:3-(3-hydroxy-phenyl)propionate hydroxylase
MADLLTRRLSQAREDSLAFGTRLVDARQDVHGVVALLDCNGRQYEVGAKFVVGADGARSLVRKLMAVEFRGYTIEEKFVSLSTSFPIENHVPNLAYVNYISDPDEWLVLLRVPGLWRVLVPADGKHSDVSLVADENVDKIFSRIVGGQAVRTAHRTIYRVHQRVADSFVKGRMLIVGDAAHLNNPLGGFGMNSGIHDIWNLCAKLWSILRKDGDVDQLAHFDRQRRKVTIDFIQAQTIENKAFMEAGGDAHRQRMERMAGIHADPVLRRQYLLRQSMFKSLEDAETIA